MSAGLWLPVRDWEGYYEVSGDNEGVRSLSRVVTGLNGTPRRLAGRPMREFLDRKGYRSVQMRRGGEKTTRRVHVLVAEAFHGAKPDWADGVRHLDDVKANCLPDNLLWGTRSENGLDAVAHGIGRCLPQTECARGHLLVEPNLVASELVYRKHRCRACRRAWNRTRDLRSRGIEVDIEAVADRCYAEIMEAAA